MRYEGTIYRPPSEAESLIIQATIGCPHNKCAFCNMYWESDFRIRPVKEIMDDLRFARASYGTAIKTIFFSDGNTILMKTENLVRILNYCHQLFPDLERITMYGSAQYIVLKTADELLQLKKAGLSRLHSGMESGDDGVLTYINKGFMRNDMIKAGQMIKNAGIELSLYYIVGLGGKELSTDHAVNSATLINAVNPDYIRLRTLIPLRHTQLHKNYIEGRFELLNAHDALRETKLFIDGLVGIDSQLLSDHVSNHCNIKGQLPHDKGQILDRIEEALQFDLTAFRAPDQGIL